MGTAAEAATGSGAERRSINVATPDVSSTNPAATPTIRTVRARDMPGEPALTTGVPC
jgi:hypothetical protein